MGQARRRRSGRRGVRPEPDRRRQRRDLRDLRHVPAFIKKAQEEGNDKAVRVFTRAKLAESVHAERYMEAYNNIDAADDDAYFLCPVCGYIEKGDDFEVCPICGAKKSAFKQF